jgi:hypothetical protein
MVSARIYIEGGGEGHLLDTLFRQGWSAFFRAAGLEGRMPRVTRGKGRSRTFDLFLTAVSHPRPGELPFLLVDSEDAVQSGHSAWQHLKVRDNWDKPNSASDDQAFLMVQLMETWFIADRKMLRRYFGPSLRETHLPAWPTLEAVLKGEVLDALDKSTAGCSKRYTKGKVSFELLAELDPTEVAKACPHAERLLRRLRSM